MYKSLNIVRLTARELAVLRLFADGHCSQDVADFLCLSKRTIDSYTARLFQKLGVRNRLRAVQVGRRLGILPFNPVS